MASERDQDTWLERLMRRRGPAAVATHRADVCLDADTVAAWADGALSGKQLAAAELHASHCARCLALLAAVERTAPAPLAETTTRGALFRWLVPLAAAATAIAIWIAIPEQQITPVAREAAPIVPAPASAPAPAPAPAVPRPMEEVLQPKVLPQQAPSARVDDLQAQSRDEATNLKEERSAAAAAPEVGQTPPPPPAPAPPAAAPTAADKFADAAGATAQRMLSRTTVIEAAGADPLIRWRVLSGTDVERSTDGGQSWVKTVSPAAMIVGIRDVDALRATVTTSDGRTLSTTDGGATWAPVQEKPAAPF